MRTWMSDSEARAAIERGDAVTYSTRCGWHDVETQPTRASDAEIQNDLRNQITNAGDC